MINPYSNRVTATRSKRRLPQATGKRDVWCRPKRSIKHPNAHDLTLTAHPCLWLVIWESPRRLVGGLDKPKGFAPQGRGRNGVCSSQSSRGLGGGLDKPKGFAPQGRAGDGAAASQPLQWSSEYADTESGLVCYDYRYYNLTDGRWTRRDLIAIEGGINVYSFAKNQLYEPDILGLVTPGIEGAVVVSQLNKLQEDNRRDNKQALHFFDQYAKYIGSKCCRNGQMIEDPYIAQAMQMCKQFVYKYSLNGRVIHPVECVAKCLSNYEATIKDVPDCQKRNSLRLKSHVGCYRECVFFLFDKNNIGVPEVGWSIGLCDLLPDFLKDTFSL